MAALRDWVANGGESAFALSDEAFAARVKRRSDKEMEADGYSLPVIEASCQYLRPAHYDDELEITTRGTLASPVRLVFDYTIDRGRDRIVTGRTAHASLNPQGRPVRLPERVRTFFA